MEEENVKNKCNCKCGIKNSSNTCNGGVYGLAFIGALIFYIQRATSFSEGFMGFLKALVWPAILIYKVLLLIK